MEAVLASMAYEGLPQPATRAGALSAEELERLFVQHHGLILRAAYRVLGSRDDAEDVLQTVFLRVARSETLRLEPSTAESYFRRAAVNAALDLLRSRKTAHAVELDAHDQEAIKGLPTQAPHNAESAEIRTWLRGAVTRLGARAAEIFTLRYLEDWDNKSIAQHLRTSQATVAVTLHRVRRQLQKDYEQHQQGGAQ